MLPNVREAAHPLFLGRLSSAHVTGPVTGSPRAQPEICA